MSAIQVDAFEVQLGAGLMIQVRDDEGLPITILADAGVHASKYEKDHVHRKLPEALDQFSQGNRCIDLIIGTHYDADHLSGLVPIIKDKRIAIGEIWLPPVADDRSPNLHGGPLSEDQFLATKWLGDGWRENAMVYLADLYKQCQELRRTESKALRFAKRAENLGWISKTLEEGDFPNYPEVEFGEERDFERLRDLFERHLQECGEIPGDACGSCHADSVFDENPAPIVSSGRTGFISRFGRVFYPWDHPVEAAEASLVLARLRKAAARSAITATHLAEVMDAINKRSDKVGVRCRTIPDGSPVELRWSKVHRKFLAGTAANDALPKISLLGPSESLVKKHRDKLPVMGPSGVSFLSRIPIEGITPSNELSYILRLESAGQGMLVSGDAGCVDYKSNQNNKYYPKLLAALEPLHVIQIAHHGGRNAHFYRVLLESKVANQSSQPFLILSHATEDKSRPSESFATFVGTLRTNVIPSLLFTSRPRPERVEGFLDLIHPVIGKAGDVGDIRLEFEDGAWHVKAHAIKP